MFMYLKILIKDLKRKKTMNVILLLFITLASLFIGSSASNMIAVMTAMDNYMEISEVSDYDTFITEEYREKMLQFLEENDYIDSYKEQRMISISKNDVKVNGTVIDYENFIFVMSDKEVSINIFDENNQKIEDIKRGYVYITPTFARHIGVKTGDKIEVTINDTAKEYTVNIAKDIICGSDMMGLTRLFINDSEYKEILENNNLSEMFNYSMELKDISKFETEYIKTGINAINITNDTLRMTYMMDMIIAGILMVVSVCLIIISLIILKFSISFTINEEFREIGIMKAIGIQNKKIRVIYIVKYFVLSVAGGVIGFEISIPFGSLLREAVAENIVMKNNIWNIIINAVCVLLVILFIIYKSFRATKRIKKMKPIAAVRNGATGERFRANGLISLNRIPFKPVVFMAINDITSKWKQFGILAVTFAMGLILIIIPINIVNTLESSEFLPAFSLVASDVYLSNGTRLTGGSREEISANLEEIKEKLADNGIDAKVYMEVLFSVNASKDDKFCSAMSLVGVGDVKSTEYAYMKGNAPIYENEVGISYVTADKLAADIGDYIVINTGAGEKEFLVTAIFQTMVNMGNSIRFYENAELSYEQAVAKLAVQIKYTNNMDKEEAYEKIAELFPEYKIQDSKSYINETMGGISTQIDNVKYLIVAVVIVINILVAVLIEKILLTKEKGEIGLLKCIGFNIKFLMHWQMLRMTMAAFIGIVIGTLLSTPMTAVSVGWIFKMMGMSSIKYTINPLEIYVVYPLIVLMTTIFAGVITSLSVRRVKATETSNIE